MDFADTAYQDTSGFYVAPIRNQTAVGSFVNLAYNPITREVVQYGFGVVIARGSFKWNIGTNSFLGNFMFNSTVSKIRDLYEAQISFTSSPPDTNYSVIATGNSYGSGGRIRIDPIRTLLSFTLNSTDNDGPLDCDFVVIR
jgi:hypothetical protein